MIKGFRPQYSLGYLILMTWVAAFCVWGGVRWWQALQHTDDFENERPAHVVTLTKPFYMGKFTVTQEQYQQVMGTNPSNFKGKDNPVEMVSWDDAQEFCKKVNAASAQAVRLPTEAEWEYACRAGTSTKYYSGDSEEDLKRVAWYYANSGNTTHPVGQKEPNRFGLYDMHGNVWQWCQDWYGEYKADAVADPQGSAQGAYRVLRGGSWSDNPGYCRSAYRGWVRPGQPRTTSSGSGWWWCLRPGLRSFTLCTLLFYTLLLLGVWGRASEMFWWSYQLKGIGSGNESLTR